jgi:hypothetical protein
MPSPKNSEVYPTAVDTLDDLFKQMAECEQGMCEGQEGTTKEGASYETKIP